MQTNTHNFTVISLGGSLIVPEEIDSEFLGRFKALVEEYIAAGNRFLLVTGGGKTTRKYQQAARAVANVTDEDMDWLGLHCTRLNGHLVRTIFKEHAHPKIFTDPAELTIEEIEEPLIIGAGWRPGWSTDNVAMLLAARIGARHIINLSNIDYVYDSDPRENPEAKKIEHISWEAYRGLIPSEWEPGLSSPFDPVAAKKAQEMEATVSIINGSNLDNLRKCLKGEAFEGTTIDG